MSSLHVAAVVVTFNRLQMLKDLVKRLDETPEVDAIIVVDNASSDGTEAWLGEQAEQNPKIHAHSLPRNTGGAGGFQTGINVAYGTGAKLLWLMDDDGMPSQNCLARLLEFEDDFDFWGPAVLAESDHSKLAFPMRIPGELYTMREHRELIQEADDEVFLPGTLCPFNGVLITRELVKRIGSVRAEYFIWGDEVEYLQRAGFSQARIATIADAEFYHPTMDKIGEPMMFGAASYNHSPSDLKHYCMCRNHTHTLLMYRPIPRAMLFWFKTAWYYTFTQPNLRRLMLSAKAICAGIRGDFNGHWRYLPKP